MGAGGCSGTATSTSFAQLSKGTETSSDTQRNKENTQRFVVGRGNTVPCVRRGVQWDPPEAAEGAAGGGSPDAFHHLSAVLLSCRAPRGLGACQRDPISKKSQKEDPGTTGPSALCQLQSLWSRSSGKAHRARAGQAGDQAQPAWVCDRQVLLQQPQLLP